MTRSLIGIVAALTFLVVPGVLRAQVSSGPAQGKKIEPLKVFDVTGDNAGKEVDFVAERKEKPTVYVFIQAATWDRPVARFLRTLDQDLAKSHNDVQIVAVWLTGDVAAAKTYLPKADAVLKLSQTTFTVFPGDKHGPAGWNIDSDAHLTAVVTGKHKVIASFGYRSVNETDVPAVVKKLAAKK